MFCAVQAAETKPAAAAPAPAPAAAAKPLTAERSETITVTAKVEAIDQKTREVTLKGQDGHVVKFVASPAVQRLNEVKVGDEVTAEYFQSLAGELRAPTEAEKAEPLVYVEGAGRAPKDKAAAGGAGRAVKVVAKVTAIDLAAQTFTLQGPNGNSGSIRAEKLENLKKLKVGDTIIVTYVEALAVSLKKAPKKS